MFKRLICYIAPVDYFTMVLLLVFILLITVIVVTIRTRRKRKLFREGLIEINRNWIVPREIDIELCADSNKVPAEFYDFLLNNSFKVLYKEPDSLLITKGFRQLIAYIEKNQDVCLVAEGEIQITQFYLNHVMVTIRIKKGIVHITMRLCFSYYHPRKCRAFIRILQNWTQEIVKRYGFEEYCIVHPLSRCMKGFSCCCG